jgi:hypothetical protein
MPAGGGGGEGGKMERTKAKPFLVSVETWIALPFFCFTNICTWVIDTTLLWGMG